MAVSPLGRSIEARYKAEPAALPDILAEIERQAGSGRKAAALIGIGETTWRRWKKGQTIKPKAANMSKAIHAVRAVRTDNKPMRVDDLKITTKDRNGRNRVITGRQMGFTDANIAQIENAYIDGGADAAAKALVSELNNTGPGIAFYAEYLEDMAYDHMESDNDYGAASASATW